MLFTITDREDDNCHNSLNGDNSRTSIEVQNGCRQVRSDNIINIQSNLSIKGTRGNLKMWSLLAVALYIQVFNNYMHHSLMGKIRLPFIDSDLLYRGAL